jgi:ribosome-associated protein YbcJ (S4-like RNA binding protein)
MNNMYDILNKLHAVEQAAQPKTETPKAKSKLAENMETVEGQLNEKYMGFKKVAAAAKAGGAKDPEAVAASIGRKKYGKEKFQHAAAAGKKLGEEQGVEEGIVDKIRAKNYDRLANRSINKAYDAMNRAADYDFDDLDNRDEPEQEFMRQMKNVKQRQAKSFMLKNLPKVEGEMAEVAPPGAKAERMVKHIKKSYAKDGKLTPKEKSIAYATAWKAHNAGKVEEAIAAVKTLVDSGMTTEQISEGWEDMMKSVKSRTNAGTGKFDKKADPTTGGTIYTRKYDPKTGETDDSENVTVVKRGRGRPKKSAFENYTDQYERSLADEGIAGTVADLAKKTGKKVLDTLGHPSDEEMIKQMQKKLNLPQTGKKPKHDTELDEMLKLAGVEETGNEEESEVCQECGMMECGCEGGHEEGHTSISMNMDNDGHQNVSVNAEGDEAVKLAQLLKLAGLGNSQPQQVYQPVEVEVADEEDMEEGNEFSGKLAKAKAQHKDSFEVDGKEYPVIEANDTVDEPNEEELANTPEEEVFNTDVQLKGGNGEVAGQEKTMHKHGAARFSDNPLAMRENVYKEYQSIKVQK